MPVCFLVRDSKFVESDVRGCVEYLRGVVSKGTYNHRLLHEKSILNKARILKFYMLLKNR